MAQAHQFAPVVHALDIGQHHARLRVVQIRVHAFERGDIGFVTAGDKVAYARARLCATVRQRVTKAATLRDDGHRAFGKGRVTRHRAKGGVNALCGVDHAQTVGPDQAHTACAGGFHQHLLAGDAFGPRFAVTRAMDHRKSHAARGAIMHGLQRRRRRQRNHRQIARAVDILYRWVTTVIADGGVTRVDGMHAPRVTVFRQ